MLIEKCPKYKLKQIVIRLKTNPDALFLKL